MRRFMFATASIAIVMASPALAQNKGHDKGQQHGKAHAQKRQAPKANRGPDRKAAARPAKRADARQDRRQAARAQDKRQDRRQAARAQDKRQDARKQADRQQAQRRQAQRQQAQRQQAQRKQAARQQDRRQDRRQDARAQAKQRARQQAQAQQRRQAQAQQRRQAQVQQRRQAARQIDRRQDARQQARRQAALQQARQQQQRIARRTADARRDARRDVRRIVTARDRDIRSYRFADFDNGRRVVRQRYVVNNDGRLRYRAWRDADYGLINGCPPGLARKGNGCLPPGQARKLWERQQARYYRDVRRANQRAERRAYYDYLAYAPRYRQADYLYDNGYAYRLNSNRSLVTAFVPLVGGALYQGNSWPQQYSYEPVPTYYSSYYGSNNPGYSYRYADDTLFGVNPQNQSITSIAGLLTGNDFAVGQPIPAGYDVYNVPYQYRSQYYDQPNAYYRYSDGYVYQVDPKTRLIQAAIQLLT